MIQRVILVSIKMQMKKVSIAIHGGAGTILKEEMTPELERAYRRALEEALDAGYAVLQAGGTAVNAVRTAAILLEDDALFNAGKGSVFTKKGLHELDAAIMDGRTLNAGAVAGVTNIRNPVELAEKVMLYSGHVFLCGEGANDFAAKHGIRLEANDYFFSQFRYDQWQAIRDGDLYHLDHSDNPAAVKDRELGTVGAVACDVNGDIAAATSTGGMTNKQFGRIGDSPLIGAGTYANNKTCAISCTGHGEIFIKAVAAYDVSAIMEYKDMSLKDAMDKVVNDKLMKMDGEGGMIGVDAEANVSMIFNSAGMYRGMRNSEGENFIGIYKD